MTSTSSSKKSRSKFADRVALAAGSLGALSVAADANADIVHFDNTNTFTHAFGGTQPAWDINGDSTVDFQFTQAGAFNTSNGALNLAEGGAVGGRGFVDTPGGFRRLASGYSVGPTLAGGYAFGARGNRELFLASYNSGFPQAVLGDFWDGTGDTVQTGFIGFRFDNAGTTNYGWADISVNNDRNAPAFTVNEWAYENMGNSIMVGATSSGAAAVPEPSSFAMLAMGAVGVAAWRRRRKPVAVTEGDQA